MKSLFFIGCLLSVGFLSLQAQDISKNAIGLRLGDDDGFGAEVSYQRGLGNAQRLEFDLGWRANNNFDAVKLAGIYQWVWNIDKGFNWYAGPGAGFVFIDFEDPSGRDDSETFIFIAGDIGVEYNFEFPLLISLDFRPEIGFGNNDDDLSFDIGLGVRYQF
ncbi:hypothetical protein NBT05_14710 [Aquimarina sp. ERC-38]|uniref:hypothetical protein n=1 Tax=Aquimarina sp. ERC-38 TaxID=2949996 RepID=UPI00224525C9|nr:hypothetical protein [Aquimarina sp. ERC-38]UZO80193.1 hypothetical protein NBT05_14710 [Aquimarina sp. ERC-38]